MEDDAIEREIARLRAAKRNSDQTVSPEAGKALLSSHSQANALGQTQKATAQSQPKLKGAACLVVGYAMLVLAIAALGIAAKTEPQKLVEVLSGFAIPPGLLALYAFLSAFFVSPKEPFPTLRKLVGGLLLVAVLGVPIVGTPIIIIVGATTGNWEIVAKSLTVAFNDALSTWFWVTVIIGAIATMGVGRRIGPNWVLTSQEMTGLVKILGLGVVVGLLIGILVISYRFLYLFFVR